MPTIVDLFEYHRPSFMEPIQRWMEQRGLVLINKGAMAAAFRNKNGEIIKVFDDDPCYRAFVDLVHKHPNPHFPRVRKVARFEKSELRGAYMVKIEPLIDLSGREWINNIGLHCYIIVEHNMFNAGNRTLFVSRVPMHSVEEILGGSPYKDSAALAKAQQYAKQFQADDPLFAKALNLVMFSKLHKCRIDLHPGNFMKRDDGTWVITDPYI